MQAMKFDPGKSVDVSNAVRWGAFRVAEYRLRHISKWLGSVIAFGLGNPILYLLSVGLGVGALVDANSGGEGVGGVPYLQFVAPALLAAAAIQGVMDEVTFPTMDGFVWDKVFFAIGATSVSSRQIANGVMIVALIRGVFTTAMYLAILLAFGAIPLSSVLPLMFTSMFAGWAFAALMLSFTARLENDDGYFAIISRFVVAPMFLFSGTFYPLEQMPIFLQPIGWVSPLWHATELGRFLSYGLEIEPLMFLVHFGYLAILGVVGMALTYPKFAERLAK
jgi:lipooligosaccharide transport system permease protein